MKSYTYNVYAYISNVYIRIDQKSNVCNCSNFRTKTKSVNKNANFLNNGQYDHFNVMLTFPIS